MTDKCRWRGGLSDVAKKKGGLPRPGRQGGETERTTTMELNDMEQPDNDVDYGELLNDALMHMAEQVRTDMRERLGEDEWKRMMDGLRPRLVELMNLGGYELAVHAAAASVAAALSDDDREAPDDGTTMVLIAGAAEFDDEQRAARKAKHN